MGKEWISIKEIGQLYIEKVLVTFDIPIFFVCRDYENRKYLCLEVDDEIGQYVISQTNNSFLLEMLKNNLTMEYLFRHSIDNKIIITEYDAEQRKVRTKVSDSAQVLEKFLPEKGAYLEVTNKLINEYIDMLSKQTIKISTGSYWVYKKIISAKIEPEFVYNRREYSEVGPVEHRRMDMSSKSSSYSLTRDVTRIVA